MGLFGCLSMIFDRIWKTWYLSSSWRKVFTFDNADFKPFFSKTNCHRVIENFAGGENIDLQYLTRLYGKFCVIHSYFSSLKRSFFKAKPLAMNGETKIVKFILVVLHGRVRRAPSHKPSRLENNVWKPRLIRMFPWMYKHYFAVFSPSIANGLFYISYKTYKIFYMDNILFDPYLFNENASH